MNKLTPEQLDKMDKMWHELDPSLFNTGVPEVEVLLKLASAVPVLTEELRDCASAPPAYDWLRSATWVVGGVALLLAFWGFGTPVSIVVPVMILVATHIFVELF